MGSLWSLQSGRISNRLTRLALSLLIAISGLQAMSAVPAVASTAPTVIAHGPVATTFVGRPIDLTASTTCEATEACPLALIYRTTGGGSRPAGAW